jgi:hypothetical protein
VDSVALADFLDRLGLSGWAVPSSVATASASSVVSAGVLALASAGSRCMAVSGVRRSRGGAKRDRRVPSSTSCGSGPYFSSAARAAALFAAKSSRWVPE